MSSLPADLTALADAYGVSTSYHDWRGRDVPASVETITAVLTALGVDVSDPAAALEHKRLDPWRRLVPATVVVTAGREHRVLAHVDHGAPLTVEVQLENGGTRRLRHAEHNVEPREVDGRLVGEAAVVVPRDLPPGYHRLLARSESAAGSVEATSTLIVAPERLELPERLRHRHAWGVATQLYSVRSRRSWGVGDLADLADLAVWSGGLGADYVLVNPLHAAEPAAPMEPSPYLPTSRMFFNPLYLRIERVPEYADLPASARTRMDRLAADVHAALDDADVIDRNTAWTAKREALLLLHAVPRSAGRELDLQAFRHRHGEALEAFATWRAIALEHGDDYARWPEELQDPDSPAVAAYAKAHLDEIAFECWLQWLLDEQLAWAQTKAVGSGMALGTMHDLAVGVHPGGADAWSMQHTYAKGIQVGAPPDAFNQVGQDWSQPPWRPDQLEEQAYLPFRQVIGAVLRHAGGVRVDHVIGLFRLWWVPKGFPPSEGTYVRYDHEALVGVLALEAFRAGAVVVGEDLGVVEPTAREHLAARGILGTSILWFERDDQGRPLPAERWRELCLASVTTHDLPPTAGYLDGEHIRLRDRLDLLTRPVVEEEAEDTAQREAWLEEVRDRGLLREGADTEETVAALHAYLTLTPSRLRCVALTDAVGDPRVQNQPGTTDEYPNWRVPLSGPDRKPLTLEDVVSSARARALANLLREAR